MAGAGARAITEIACPLLKHTRTGVMSGSAMHLHLRMPATNDGRPVKGLMWGLSIFTMVMTVPQILTIWIHRQANGVSALSWSAYLTGAVVWLWYGLRKRDVNIY